MSELKDQPQTLQNQREIPIKTERGEAVSVIILDNPTLLPLSEQQKYASAMEDISGADIIPKEKVLEQFEDHKNRRWYFLLNPQGRISSYGTVSLDTLDSGEKSCYIAKIATEVGSRGKGYATCVLDAIMAEGFDQIWTFNAIAETPEGDALRRMHERKGFVAKDPPGTPTNLYWTKPPSL